jgi:hypothetical protein
VVMRRMCHGPRLPGSESVLLHILALWLTFSKGQSFSFLIYIVRIIIVSTLLDPEAQMWSSTWNT